MDTLSTTIMSFPGFGTPINDHGMTPMPPSARDSCHIWDIFLATALAGGAGIRSVAPIFLLSFFHRMDPELYPLSHGTQWLGHHGVCMFLGLVLLIEVVADQVPAVDHALHAILTPAHPITGALAAVAPAYCGGFQIKIPMAFIGATTALSVHAGKSAVRHVSSHTTCGTLNPIISIVESVVSVVLMVLCFLIPVASVVAVGLFIAAASVGAKKLWEALGEESAEGDLEESSEDEETKQKRRENRQKRRATKQQEREGGIAQEGLLGDTEDDERRRLRKEKKERKQQAQEDDPEDNERRRLRKEKKELRRQQGEPDVEVAGE